MDLNKGCRLCLWHATYQGFIPLQSAVYEPHGKLGPYCYKDPFCIYINYRHSFVYAFSYKITGQIGLQVGSRGPTMVSQPCPFWNWKCHTAGVLQHCKEMIGCPLRKPSSPSIFVKSSAFIIRIIQAYSQTLRFLPFFCALHAIYYAFCCFSILFSFSQQSLSLSPLQ